MMMNDSSQVAAIVLAAGMSQRMGSPKMALPWKGSTVLGTVINVIYNAGIKEICVVTGGSREIVEGIVESLHFPVAMHFNPNYENGEMLDSIKVGITGLHSTVKAVLIALGDQPQIETSVISMLVSRYNEMASPMIVPSFRMHRGHPWLIDRKYWPEIMGMSIGQTMRDFFKLHSTEIDMLAVNTQSVMQDLDTPEDYRSALEE